MKKMFLTFVVLLLALTAHAEDTLIEKGFNAFKEKGSDGAFKVWAEKGPLEGTKELKALSAQFDQLSAYYGNYSSHDYVLTTEFSPKNKVVFLILNLDSGPMYGRFVLFKTDKDFWTIPSFNFHPYPEQVWPPQIITRMAQ